jgi:putative restriction endonuclease
VRYWWVNQNQTYRHEVHGGYLWSPKRKANGDRNPFYEFMREVAPGDIIFSFSETRIAAIGIARSFCDESPKPAEFGSVGLNWSTIGWKIDVRFQELRNRIRPMDHLETLAPLLPARYAPFQSTTGYGLQSVYLTAVPVALAAELMRLIGSEVSSVRDVAANVAGTVSETPAAGVTVEEWEKREETLILEAPTITETERRALVMARKGQGVFRQNVMKVEKACRVTGVTRTEHLVASHTKPWRDSDNTERLDGENGFLLTPTIDHLFDKGFISFENNGKLIVSPRADPASIAKMGINPGGGLNVGAFSSGQRRFLDYHREYILRMAAVRG